jgi:hypothetical protein
VVKVSWCLPSLNTEIVRQNLIRYVDVFCFSVLMLYCTVNRSYGSFLIQKSHETSINTVPKSGKLSAWEHAGLSWLTKKEEKDGRFRGYVWCRNVSLGTKWKVFSVGPSRCYKTGFVNQFRAFPCGGGVEYLHRYPASRRRRRKRMSPIWDSNMWSRVPRNSHPSLTALAISSSKCKRQTRPVVRENAPINKPATVRQ